MTGFNSKREAAADKMQEPEREALKLALEALEAMQMYAAAERKGLRICDEAITAIKEALAQPVQEPDWKTMPPKDAPLVQWAKEQTAPPQREWIWLSDADIAEVVDTTCQYTGSYEEYLIKKAERKIRSMNT